MKREATKKTVKTSDGTKSINTAKFLSDVQTLICNKFEFSFSIDVNSCFEITYNGDKGKAKIMLDQDYVTAHAFVTQLINHKNCKGHSVHPSFWEVATQESKDQAPKDYKKIKGTIYFDCSTMQVISGDIDFTNEHLRKADAFESDRLPGFQILKPKDNGFMVSVIYGGYVWGIQYFENEGDKVQAAIDFVTSKMDADGLRAHIQKLIVEKTGKDGKQLENSSKQAQNSSKSKARAGKDAKAGKQEKTGEKRAKNSSKKAAKAGDTAKAGKAAQNGSKGKAKAGRDGGSVDALINKTLQAKEYEILNKAIYFNADFKVVEYNAKELQAAARLVKLLDFDNVMLATHRMIDGSSVSLVYKGFLYEFEDMTSGGDQIQKAVDLIKLKGIDTILKQAEERLPKAA